PSMALVVVTKDLIAAELLGLALRRETADPDANSPGVWEDPLVQRATELHLGVALPSMIKLTSGWAHPEAPPKEFEALVTRLRPRLGLAPLCAVVDDNIAF
ncbi:MAG: hypothetical protein M3R06_08110, partial [Chloroflexota bacterium]|nr:hypothetical protein [Chloroflexota bacterium]